MNEPTLVECAKIQGMFFRKQYWLVILMSTILGGWSTVRAQTQITVVLSQPLTNTYPRLTAFLDVHDENNLFIRGLAASRVSLLEDGKPVDVLTFEEYSPGMQLVIAVNPGESFTVHNSQGVSRYDLLSKSMVEWASGRLGSTLDDLSLLFASGGEYVHFNNYDYLLDTLTAYQIGDPPGSPGLDILGRAIELANDPLPRPGMERAILFITAPVKADIASGMQTLLAQANQQGIRFFIWYVASSQLVNTPDIEQFDAMSEESGGSFVRYSGDEELPNPEKYFSQLRNIYQLTYNSQMNMGGEHELLAQLDLNDAIIKTDPVRFNFDLQPPNPVFLSPQLQIKRSVPSEKQVNMLEEITPADLLPDQQEFKILVEFPDGRARPILHSALFVDGIVVDENINEPFDRFQWNLQSYIESGQHILSIKIQDAFGLEATSIDMPVELIVDLPAPNPLRGLLRRWPLLVGLAAILFSAVFLVALILLGRLRPGYRLAGVRYENIAGSKKDRIQTPAAIEPASQSSTGGRLPEWVNRFHWPRRRINPNAHAYLTRLEEAGTPLQTIISITADEVSFGQDPDKAMFVIDDTSIEGLHARLLRDENDQFVIYDQGSVAGTWVNYLEVLKEGTPLTHGDIIHIGRAGFRFTQRIPRITRKPVVTLLEPPL